jgi:creatinine amidohydrolase
VGVDPRVRPPPIACRLLPDAECRLPNAARYYISMQFGEMNWRQAGEATGRVVVVPLGSLEQHGWHLPLLTDAMIGSEIARRSEAELGDEALFLPTLWLGASDHHRSFSGTVSVATTTYARVLYELVDSLIGSGFRRIFLLNAHAGNVNPARVALTDLQIRYRRELPDLYLAFASWFDLARVQVAAVPGLSQTQVSHACEWETGAILATRPDLVGDERPATRRAFDSAFWCPDFRQPSRVDVARTLEQSSPTGALGYPERATAESGEAILRAATAEVVAFVREFATWPPTPGGSEE